MDGSSNSQPRKRGNRGNSQKQTSTSESKAFAPMLLAHKRCLEEIERKLRPNNLHGIGSNIVESFSDDLKIVLVELRKMEANMIVLNTTCNCIEEALFHIYGALDTIKHNDANIYDSSLRVQYYQRLRDCGTYLKQAIYHFPTL